MPERDESKVEHDTTRCNDCAPVALFVFNRPEHARRTVEALQRNRLAAESDLIVFSDGPRSEAQAEAVRQTREYLRTIDGFRSVRIVERAENIGLARSVIDGVTSVVNEYGRVIVLEDDLVTLPNFLEYMNEGLEKYSQDESVMQISGHMFPVTLAAGTDAVFLPMTTSWGWATWLRAWRNFDPSATGHEELLRDRMLRRAFDLDGSYPYSRMLEAQMRGDVDSWAIRWWLSVFRRGGLTLFPCRSLVQNIGFDGSGTHCGTRSQEQMAQVSATGLKLPQVIQVDEDAKRAVWDYLAGTQGNSLTRLIRRIRNALGE